MKRHGFLFERVISFENLLKAAKKAERGKRLKEPTAEFNLRLETELLELQKELRFKTYRMGKYQKFFVWDPKKRLINALPYRDRVVQHALCSVIEPIFDRSFVYDTYACRRGKGSHKAVNKFTAYSRKNKYALKCDIKSYFAYIDHEVLFVMIKQRIKDPAALWLIRLIIDSTPSPGIPIGNLASQIFANLFLDGLDHYFKEKVKCGFYIRYMDDLIIFGNDKSRLNEIKGEIKGYLGKLKLEMHPGKSQIHATSKGICFLGYKIFPTHRLIIRRNLKRFRRRMKRHYWQLKHKLINWQRMVCSAQSWFGYAIHADSFNLRRRLSVELELKGINP